MSILSRKEMTVDKNPLSIKVQRKFCVSHLGDAIAYYVHIPPWEGMIVKHSRPS